MTLKALSGNSATETSALDNDVSNVYAAYAKLKDGEAQCNIDKNIGSYEYLLSSVQGGVKVRTLLADFIPTFLHLFPSCSERAINAQLDLCEDTEINVRIVAIRGLQRIGEGSPQHIMRIADVLGQLLCTDEGPELRTVKSAYSAIFQLDFEAALAALFVHLQEAPQLRNRLLDFLREHTPKFIESLSKSEGLQNIVIAATQKTFAHRQRASANEIDMLLSFVNCLPLFHVGETSNEMALILLNGCEQALSSADISQTQLVVDEVFVIHRMLQKAMVSQSVIFERIVYKLLDATHWKVLTTASRISLLRVASEFVVTPNTLGDDLALRFGRVYYIVKSRQDNVQSADDAVEFEAMLLILHRLAHASPIVMRQCCGIFIATGQPSDFREDILTKRNEFESCMDTLRIRTNEFSLRFKKSLKASNTLEVTNATQNVLSMITAFRQKKPVFGAVSVKASWINVSKANKAHQNGKRKSINKQSFAPAKNTQQQQQQKEKKQQQKPQQKQQKKILQKQQQQQQNNTRKFQKKKHQQQQQQQRVVRRQDNHNNSQQYSKKNQHKRRQDEKLNKSMNQAKKQQHPQSSKQREQLSVHHSNDVDKMLNQAVRTVAIKQQKQKKSLSKKRKQTETNTSLSSMKKRSRNGKGADQTFNRRVTRV